MAQAVPLKKTTLSPGAVCKLTLIGLALCVQCSAFAAGSDPTRTQSSSSLPGSDTIHSIQLNKAQTSKKHKIKLYPDARQQVFFFSATAQEGKIYHLYLFDMDGRLLRQTRIRSLHPTGFPNSYNGTFVF